jgi:hypothetical protein
MIGLSLKTKGITLIDILTIGRAVQFETSTNSIALYFSCDLYRFAKNRYGWACERGKKNLPKAINYICDVAFQILG